MNLPADRSGHCKPQPVNVRASGAETCGERIDAVVTIVDLDGTLCRSDTLHELVLRLFVQCPISTIAALLHVQRSRTELKAELAGIAPHLNLVLPWNLDVVAAVREKRAVDAIVCTASNQDFARRVIAPLQLFTSVHGSDRDTNLKGAAKAAFLSECLRGRPYVYYGDDWVDLPVWAQAAGAVVVSDDLALLARVREICPKVEHLAPARQAVTMSMLRALRPHQWTKNLLVFVPVLTSHRFGELPVLLDGLLAFVCFCMLSSAVYVINDVLDLDADRLHASKRKRPFASGDLSVLWAPPLGGVLATVSLALAFQSSVAFGLACSAYLVLSLLYSTVFKKVALLDVFVLAALYTLRLLAGGALTGIPISVWLAAFSAFIFLSLALCKRYVEILELPPHPAARIARRGYGTGDASFVLTQGLIAMGCASLVLAVYLSSTAVTLLYRTPGLLWGAVAVVSFWGARIWLLASRRELHDDPVLFALKDPVSWVCLGLLFAVFFAAMLLG